MENDGMLSGDTDGCNIEKDSNLVTSLNNNVQNGKYFNEYRIVAIKIVEHNSDENKVIINQTASLNGGDISAPPVQWVHDGDMAGNKSGNINYGNSVATNDFVIDTEIKSPTISGVENRTAYKNDIAINISFADVNLNTNKIELTRTRMNEKDVDVTKEFIKNLIVTENSVQVLDNEIAELSENDGIYKLSVTYTDMAGNEASHSVIFTINRCGSVYMYNDRLTELTVDRGAYVKKVDSDLVIAEYNADRLVADSLAIVITRGGKPIQDTVYEVAPIINDAVEVGNSGWFQYKYTISSKDEAGNTLENTNYDNMGILFHMDKTVPELTSVVDLEQKIINAQELEILFSVFDVIGLKLVEIYVGDKLLDKSITDFFGRTQQLFWQFHLA